MKKPRYTTRQDRNGKFYVMDLDGKDVDIYMPTRKAARDKARQLNETEQLPPQAA